MPKWVRWHKGCRCCRTWVRVNLLIFNDFNIHRVRIWAFKNEIDFTNQTLYIFRRRICFYDLICLTIGKVNYFVLMFVTSKFIFMANFDVIISNLSTIFNSSCILSVIGIISCLFVVMILMYLTVFILLSFKSLKWFIPDRNLFESV